MSAELPITMPAYARMHAVIRAVLDGVQAHTAVACVFFALAGARMLAQHHRLPALPMAGAAFYGLGGDQRAVISFGHIEGADITSDERGFHCWIECGEWVIDLMAPIFQENTDHRGCGLSVPRRMLQRRRSTLSSRWETLSRDGDCYLAPNLALSTRLFEKHLGRPGTQDLIEVCSHWYRRPPARIADQMGLSSDDGTTTLLTLKPPVLVGTW